MLKKYLKKFIRTRLRAFTRKIDEAKILNAQILVRLNENNQENIFENIQLAEFKVFSQWGDDGIIQFLVNHLEIENKTFVEFGVENYQEANTRFLLINNNWKGLVMDGSLDNIAQIKDEDIAHLYDLTATNAFITKENINELIRQAGIQGDIGLLHIDIDGNDYWVWEEINCINPIIAIVEYNSLLGYERSLTIPYSSDFQRTKYHYSNLYYGASLSALCDLAELKGYYFIGSNSIGNNAYFVRKDKIGRFKPLSAKEGYVESKFSESRDENGNLTFVRYKDRQNIIAGKPFYDLRQNKVVHDVF